MPGASFQEVAKAAKAIQPFIASAQLYTVANACRGEEGEFFQDKLVSLSAQIQAMPKTYDQDGMGDTAVAHLHYFMGGSDWYITEKDMDDGVSQAFGYAKLAGCGDCAEMGYISIAEIVRCGAELDLYFKPCTLAEVKEK